MGGGNGGALRTWGSEEKRSRWGGGHYRMHSEILSENVNKNCHTFRVAVPFYSTHLTSKPPVTLLLGTWIYTSQNSQPLSIWAALMFGFNLHFPGEWRWDTISDAVSQELFISRRSHGKQSLHRELSTALALRLWFSVENLPCHTMISKWIQNSLGVTTKKGLFFNAW